MKSLLGYPKDSQQNFTEFGKLFSKKKLFVSGNVPISLYHSTLAQLGLDVYFLKQQSKNHEAQPLLCSEMSMQ